MDVFNKKRLQALEEGRRRLESQLRELQSEHETLKRASAGLDRTNVRLQQDISGLKTQIQELSGGNSQLRRQLEAALSDLRKALEAKEIAEQELLAIKKTEERREELAKQLIIAEQDLIFLIKDAKLRATVLIRNLKKVMDRYSFMRYAYLHMPSEEDRKRQQLIFPKGGNYTKEVWEEAARRNVIRSDGLIEDGESKLKDSFMGLLHLNRLLEQLAKLFDEEKIKTEAIKKSDDYINKIVIAIYKPLYDDYFQHTKVEALTDMLINAFKNGLMQEAQLEHLNGQIISILKNILVGLMRINELLSSRAIGVFYREFDNLQQSLLRQVKDLYAIFIDKINKNEQFVQKLIAMRDSEIEKTQEAFGIFLRSGLETEAEAIARAQKRKNE